MRLSIVLQSCILAALFSVSACRSKKTELVWDKSFEVIGSQSSPRTADLNGDGVLDIVMGAGKNEFQQSERGILALDGNTGDILWQQQSVDQVYGSATFLDVTGDGVLDIFIGGRAPHFKALDGKTGGILWEYHYDSLNSDGILRNARFNFCNSVLVPDQSNDGLADLLTVNGGNAYADPYKEDKRYPAVLMIFDSKTGHVIASDTMPDGKESYQSPLYFVQPGTTDQKIIFGTGGETIDGNLYEASLLDLLERKLSRAKIIASDKGHGFIAPAVLADITKDGLYDIVAISHGSNVFAIDGRDHHIIWTRTIANTECSNAFAVGEFTGDDVPDFFTFVSRGQWPNSTGTLQIMLSGEDGRANYLDSLGCTGFSSPVIYDLNHDGVDEAIISINEFDCALGFTGTGPREIQNRLIAIDFKANQVNPIDQTKGFKNVFSTPWIGDLDNDGYLDIFYCQYFHNIDLLGFLGMRVKRISTHIRMKEEPVWGAYMSSKGDGIYPLESK